jgi:hypothetical protein
MLVSTVGSLRQLDERQLVTLCQRLERRVRLALSLGDGEITRLLLDDYLAANDEIDRRFKDWCSSR